MLLAGKYELLEQIGEGGMARLYKARNVQLESVCCVKVLQPSMVNFDQAVMRLRREAANLAALDHPNILRVLAMDKDGDQYFIVTEYLEGVSLDKELAKGKPAEDRIRAWLADLLNGLDYAHERGIVHRDIKPANLFLVRDAEGREHLKILDFGIAKMLNGQEFQRMTQTGAIVGSPLYMAPEQCSGEAVTERSDIYSVGCLLYECLDGTPPYVGDSSMEVMIKHLHDKTPLAVPGVLGQIAARAMHKSPEHRFGSAREMLDAIENEQLPSGVPVTSAKSKLVFRKPKVRHVAAAFGVVCAAGVLAFLLNSFRTPVGSETFDLPGDDRTPLQVYHDLWRERDIKHELSGEQVKREIDFVDHAALDAFERSELTQFKGMYLSSCGRTHDSEVEYVRALKMAKAANATNAWAIKELATDFLLIGNEEEAINFVRSEISDAERMHNPRNDMEMLDTTMAYLLQSQNRYSEAQKYYDHAIELFRHNQNFNLIHDAVLVRDAAVNSAYATRSMSDALKRQQQWLAKNAAKVALARAIVESIEAESLIAVGDYQTALERSRKQQAEFWGIADAKLKEDPANGNGSIAVRQVERMFYPIALAYLGLHRSEEAEKSLNEFEKVAKRDREGVWLYLISRQRNRIAASARK